MEHERPQSPADGFSPDRYWEERLGNLWAIEGVGLVGHGHWFNNILYRVRRQVFLDEVRKLPLDVPSARILDLGSGTGFYVDLWQSLGAKSVTGSDLTQAAVQNLRRTNPTTKFLQFDIGDPALTLEPESFDVISIFDVFFHIVDDERFSQALVNISKMLRPGGFLVFSDVLLRSRPEGPHGDQAHVVWRSETVVRERLSQAGLIGRESRAVFVLLIPPMDTRSRVLQTVCRIIAWLARHGEVTGALIGTIVYPLERLLLRWTRLAPSTKMMVAEKSPHHTT